MLSCLVSLHFYEKDKGEIKKEGDRERAQKPEGTFWQAGGSNWIPETHMVERAPPLESFTVIAPYKHMYTHTNQLHINTHTR